MEDSEEPMFCFNFVSKIIRFFDKGIEYNSEPNILEARVYDSCDLSNVFELLPNEILFEISSYLSPEDIIRLSHTCKTIRNFLVADKAFITEYCNIMKIRVSIAEDDIIKAMLGEHYYLQGRKTREVALLTTARSLGNKKAKNYLDKLSSLRKKNQESLNEQTLLNIDYSSSIANFRGEGWL